MRLIFKAMQDPKDTLYEAELADLINPKPQGPVGKPQHGTSHRGMVAMTATPTRQGATTRLQPSLISSGSLMMETSERKIHDGDLSNPRK